MFLLNIGSFVLGIVSLALPLISVIKNKNKYKYKERRLISLVSITACAISIWLLYAYIGHLVNIEDWSAVLDITVTMVKASGLYLLLVLVLNFFVLKDN